MDSFELIAKLLVDASDYGGYCFGDYMINVLIQQAYNKEVKPFKTVDLLFPDEQKLQAFLAKHDTLIKRWYDFYDYVVQDQHVATVCIQCGTKPHPLIFDTDNVVCQYQPKIKQFEQEYKNKLERLKNQYQKQDEQEHSGKQKRSKGQQKSATKLSKTEYEARVKATNDAHEELAKSLQGQYDIYFLSLDRNMVVCQLAAKIRDKQCTLLDRWLFRGIDILGEEGLIPKFIKKADKALWTVDVDSVKYRLTTEEPGKVLTESVEHMPYLSEYMQSIQSTEHLKHVLRNNLH